MKARISMGILDSLRNSPIAELSIKDKFSNRLEMLLKDFGLQKKELANKIGVSAVTITKYTKGITMPSLDALFSLAAYFNVTVDYLIGRTDEAILKEDFVYFSPIGKIPYYFKISDDEKISGELQYIFGLTVWNVDLSKDEHVLNQFLCFRFSNERMDQRLYECLFLTDELNVGYFLYTMSSALGLPFMEAYEGPLSKNSQYLANLLIWNETGIKPPIGQTLSIEPQYLTTLQIPTANEKVRLNHTFTSSAMPHLQAWMAMSDRERIDMLMRRLRHIKSNYR